MLRDAVRHPWTGAVACDVPVRGVRGRPPDGLDNGRARPATGIAYAPRGNVQLASFLRTEVSALDVQATGVAPPGVGTFTAPSSGPAIPPGPAKRDGCLGCATTPSEPGKSAVSCAAVFALLAAFRARRARRG